MERRRGRCPDCDGGAVVGSGRCSKCYGSGTNLKLTSDQPQCPACGGTGICATCHGEGAFVPDVAQEIQKLFE